MCRVCFLVSSVWDQMSNSNGGLVDAYLWVPKLQTDPTCKLPRPLFSAGLALQVTVVTGPSGRVMGKEEPHR